ncbi:potassium ion transporter [Aspergillus undulatus]|uniref:potassium ion transporter n=1 Tax=Aspergillus undulatus TaxID=1810928 RepID=UPI003CCD3E83
MFSALLRQLAQHKARIPWLRDLHLNFILIHYTYIIAMALIVSVIIYPGSDLKYIDALFFAAGAATQSGLNTVDFNLLYTYQQVILYFVSMLTTPIFINTALVFVRLYWFEKRFQHVVRDARALRSTRSRLRTISEDKSSHSYDREEAGINGRPIVVLRNDFANQPQNDGPPSAPKSPEDSESESPSPTLNGTSTPKPEVRPEGSQSQLNNGTINRDFGSLRVPAQLDPEHHIAFLEKQRKNKGALRIPSPREYDRGGAPEVLEEEDNEDSNNKLAKTGSGMSEPRSPRNVDQDNTPTMDGPHITINEPELPRSRTRNSTFPRLDTRPTFRETKDGDDPTLLSRSNRRPTFSGIVRSLTVERDRPTLPYLSWDATVGRNSNFVDLTEEQRDELGGIEYRALKTLAVVLICYYVLFHALGAICLLPWIMETRWGDVVKAAGQGRPWWAFFTAASAFNDVGFSLMPDSMVQFQTAIFPLLLMTFLIIIGNTAFPCMLRFIIWTLSKIVSKETPLWEELKFLLDHPRRCFTLLFPRNATWWLFAILVLLNGIDLIFFIILDLNDPTVTSLSTGIKILDGLFQASCTRTAGFAVVSISELHPAVQVSYMIMMYISVFPIAISLRRTNVYEEKSLGVFEGDEDLDDENQTAPSYIGTHLRRQLGFDLWYVCLGVFIITIVEGDRLENTSEYSFQIWSVLFEVVSAYGTVGLSLGFPGVNASFVSQFRVISTLVIIAMQIRGRHRGLPNSLDKAILLPSESLHQKEVLDAEKRMRRRTSNLSQIGSLGRQQSTAVSENGNGVSSALDARERNTELNTGINADPLRRQPTLRSQRSQSQR